MRDELTRVFRPGWRSALPRERLGHRPQQRLVRSALLPGSPRGVFPDFSRVEFPKFAESFTQAVAGCRCRWRISRKPIAPARARGGRIYFWNFGGTHLKQMRGFFGTLRQYVRGWRRIGRLARVPDLLPVLPVVLADVPTALVLEGEQEPDVNRRLEGTFYGLGW